MNARSAVFAILSSRGGVSAASDGSADDAPLGEDGLGLDSIAIAEVLLECEERFGARARALLDVPVLTVRRLIEHAESAARR